MASDGQIVFEVTADGKHAIADIKEITRAIQQETGKWDDAAKDSANNIESTFSSMLKKLVAGFSAVKIGKALLDIGKDALEAASALEEVQNVVDTTFGDNAGQIERWAKNAGEQFGLTETKAKQFTSTMGAMLKSSGLAGDEIVSMSTDLAGLAADMASFYNLDFDEAFAKIRSGISGETEPLKQLGINMSVANLNAYALQQGLDKTFEQMTQGEQVMLRYQYMMSATSDAQGDFAKTSDGYANSLRRAESAVEGIKAQLGAFLIGPAADALNWVNDFLGKITQQQPTTVLDDFNAIDIDTEGKLLQIHQVAEEARLLTDELDRIGGSKADKAGSKVQQLATDLSNINLDEGKAGAVQEFISVLSNNIDTLANIQGTSNEQAVEWLNGIAAAANELDADDAKGWETLINTIKEGLPGFENTDFGANFFATLSGGFASVSEQSSVLQWAVETLGDKTNKTAEEQALWLETCKRLVQTIPGLNAIINTETGEVKGGTQAIKDYIKAWEEGQEKLVLLGALDKKEAALASRFSDIPELQLDLALAERTLRKNKADLEALYEKYGIDKPMTLRKGSAYATQMGFTDDDVDTINAVSQAYWDAEAAVIKARDAYQTQADALEEAKEALIEYRKTIDEQYPDAVDSAIASTQEWSDEAKANAKTLIDAAKSNLTALADYAEGVRDSVAKAVDSVVKGFTQIKRPVTELEEQRDKLIQEQMALDSTAKDYQQKWDAIEDKIDNVNKQIEQFEPKGMKDALTSQIAFMTEYMDNLEKARQLGLSNELLASLSDGTTESAEYLMQLVADPEAAKEIDALYAQVQQKKKEFTDELTGQQLTADAVYQNMAAQAKAAVEALDLEGEAKDNAGKTISGMAQGIADHVSEVQASVDDIVAQLDRLNGWGISFDFGEFGGFSFTVNATNPIDGEFETGLDRVPFDGFLASLHEGEGILTAEENRVWQRFKNGGNSGTDYDTLGGVMRDNIKAGGNVYLDGRIVGDVISDQQGKQYRQLTRSGWQK